jgi:transcriptional regulator with XRE-family HTH domain
MPITKEQRRTFKTTLTQWREKHKWVHKEAADKLDVSLGGYRKWENGQRTPDSVWMEQIFKRMSEIDAKA